MSDETGLAKTGVSALLRPEETAWSVEQVTQQIAQISKLMKAAMQENVHYGIIPGCEKPSLFKAGSEKLCTMFRLASHYDVAQIDLPNGHREYKTKCTLTHIPTGIVWGEGEGTCSTMESRYRYRRTSSYEVLDEEIPKDYREQKKAYRDKGFGCKQVDGQWLWVKYGESGREENPDIADCYNTCLKISQKRAKVGVTIECTGASDIFTQDIEDLPPEAMGHPQPAAPKKVDAQVSEPTRHGSDAGAPPERQTDGGRPSAHVTELPIPDDYNKVLDDGTKRKDEYYKLGWSCKKINNEWKWCWYGPDAGLEQAISEFNEGREPEEGAVEPGSDEDLFGGHPADEQD